MFRVPDAKRNDESMWCGRAHKKSTDLGSVLLLYVKFGFARFGFAQLDRARIAQ